MITLKIWKDTERDGWIGSFELCDNMEEAREVACWLVSFPPEHVKRVEVEILNEAEILEVYR